MALPKAGDRAIVVSAPRKALVRQLHATITERVGADACGMFFSDVKEPGARVVVTCNASLGKLAETLITMGRRVALAVPDEAHGTEGRGAKAALEVMRPASLVGFTATPFRSVPKQSLSLFTRVVYRYTMQQAMEDRVLVPMKYVRFEGENPGTVDEECLNMMRAHGDGPGIVSADTIEDCETYAAWLTAQGFPAMPIHSKMNGAERTIRMDTLREGGVRCLVHVALLSEGVDLPWLRWICLRRRVMARVRFLQEIGRVFRVCPEIGKTEGIVIDPHLLLGVHGLTSLEAIGKALEEAALAEEKEEEEEREQEKQVRRQHEVMALDSMTAFIHRVREAMIAHGMIERKPEFEGSTGWRLVMMSERQSQALQKASRFRRYMPQEVSMDFEALMGVKWAMNRGQVSDLLDILYASVRWAKDKATKHGIPIWMVRWSAEYLDGVERPAEGTREIIRGMKPETDGGEE